MPNAICLCTINTILAFAPYLSNDESEPQDAHIGDYLDVTSTEETPPWDATSNFVSYEELLKDVFFFVSQHPGSDADDVARYFGITLREAIQVTEDLLKQGMLDFS